MLESLEQSNIKKMSVENPEQKPEIFFDPEKEIGPEDVQLIQFWLAKTLKDGAQLPMEDKWSSILNALSVMKIFGHDLKKTVYWSQAELSELQERLRKQMEHPINRLDLNEYVRVYELFPELGLNPPTTFIDEIWPDVEYFRSHESWISLISLALTVRRIDPDLQILTAEDMKKIREDVVDFSTRSDEVGTVDYFSVIREFDPGFDVTPYKKDIQAFRDYLPDLKERQDWSGYLHWALTLYRLNGKNKPKFQSEQPAIPEQRQF